MASRYGGNRELDVRDAHQDVVDAPARIARDEADDDAERAGQADGDHAHEQRDARAVDEPAQDVAADLVGAEDVAAVEAGGLQALGDVLLVRAERREALGEDRGEQDDSERGGREPEDGVAPHHADSERTRGSSAA